MSATPRVSRPASLNRRRRVRQKVHAPAYATIGGDFKNGMVELCEVLDISEVGVAIQSGARLQADDEVQLSLDLAECSGPICAPARVVWTDQSGRVGFCLPVLSDALLHRLREWLFLNSIAGAANAASVSPPVNAAVKTGALPAQNYTDTLAAAASVIREAESLGTDLEAVLKLIASRSNSLLRASGTAIALAEETLLAKETLKEGAKKDGRAVSSANAIPRTMTCRASAGHNAPPVGAILQVGSGFSGKCVRSRKALYCEDAETDDRVDRESCRALGLRSMLAVPIVSGEQSIGLLEVFSTQPRAFEERHSSLLLRFADAVVAALSRTSAAEVPIHEKVAAPQISWTPPGSVLFAQAPQAKSSAAEIPNQPEEKTRSEDEISFGKIHLSRTRLYLLITVAAAVALALGFILAPWFHEKFHSRAKTAESPVLASSSPSTLKAKLPTPATRLTTLEQLRELAQSSDPAAENALGLLYAQGDEKQGIAQNESEAARWFTKAAEHGSVPAQYKLGLLFWGGHGVPKDATKAYFWAVLARAGGQDGSKDLAKVLANGMTRAQSAAIEQQAEIWYQQHQPKTRADASQ